MNINIYYFSNLQDAIKWTAHLRDIKTKDVALIVQKHGNSGLILSADFIEDGIDCKYAAEHNIDVFNSPRVYGKYGCVISIPNITFNVLIPMYTKEAFTMPYIKAMYCRLWGEEKCNAPDISSNDFTVDGKKVIGGVIFPDTNQYYSISTLSNFSEELDAVFTPSFYENSGKTKPSERVMGYREAVGNPDADIEDFARDLKFRMNEQLKNTIQEIAVFDMDKEGESVV